MSTEIVQHTTSLADQIEFARMVTTVNGGDRTEVARQNAQSILPDSYKGNPANVLIAVGLGAAMGLSPAESMYRISVIKGKPSASAELIAANVRKAGHKLRVKVTENPPSATCTIIRSDDPDEPLTIERDMAWAQRMGLANEPNYKKQPSTMLSYRAITACARLACPEALYGVSYTPDEARDIAHDETAPAPVPSAADFQPAAAVPTQQAAPTVEPTAEDVQDVDVVDEPDRTLTDNTRKKMFALLSEVDPEATAATQRKGMSLVLGREIKSRTELDEDDALRVIDALNAEKRKRAIATEQQGESGEQP